MKLVIFCVRDSATDQYGTPMFLQSAGQAIRSFTDEVNRKDETNQLWRHPMDFELFTLGEWDTESGLFVSGPPMSVITGKAVAVRE